MATGVKEQLQEATVALDGMTEQMGKIKGETDGLKDRVKTLEDTIANTPPGGIPQDVLDAAQAVSDATGRLKTAVQGVDDEVEDPAEPTDPSAPQEP